ncbi:hypothetical protein LEP1GSC125_1263 [Leptospira mayottensis 200901122]|uniref:Uncharacterized protein n=1 Tax=Leptospira mayottensis 200901122 TaxID=1193010 RepID=A0AA87SUU8_9LEPT|nr:hypothetical protein LEP1GSC125_1263 [Leptospira mayottensis 200901122]
MGFFVCRFFHPTNLKPYLVLIKIFDSKYNFTISLKNHF